jgi:hypothetical protein
MRTRFFVLCCWWAANDSELLSRALLPRSEKKIIKIWFKPLLLNHNKSHTTKTTTLKL